MILSVSPSSIMVSPLLISLHPVIAPMSPTPISVRIYASSARTRYKDWILSFLFKFELTMCCLFFMMPEYTRKNVTRPFSLSFTTLNASAHSFSFFDGYLIMSSPVMKFFPRATVLSGDGK